MTEKKNCPRAYEKWRLMAEIFLKEKAENRVQKRVVKEDQKQNKDRQTEGIRLEKPDRAEMFEINEDEEGKGRMKGERVGEKRKVS